MVLVCRPAGINGRVATLCRCTIAARLVAAVVSLVAVGNIGSWCYRLTSHTDVVFYLPILIQGYLQDTEFSVLLFYCRQAFPLLKLFSAVDA